MELIFCHYIPQIILFLTLFFLLMSLVFPNNTPINHTEINRPYVKSIQSPDGDIIDCVLIHLQPAFDHPKLKGSTVADPPEVPHGQKTVKKSALKQLWSLKGESCPDGTIPIRRTNTYESFKPIPISKFGRNSNKDSLNDHEEHAIGYVKADKYYGAHAILNLWRPRVTHQNEFSSSVVWVTTDIPNHDINTIEAGWTVSPGFYKDNSSRLFIYWTNDGYRSGCFDLKCPGFVQTNKNVALGMALHPVSKSDGEQYSIDVLIWKDVKTGNWWLKVGDDLVGYWPATLFSDLKDHATLIEFGGLVFNAKTSGQHTTTQMGSGQFSFGGFKEAAYVKELGVVDFDNNVNPVVGLNVLADRPKCYDVRSGQTDDWGSYIYFGGPGKNLNCP